MDNKTQKKKTENYMNNFAIEKLEDSDKEITKKVLDKNIQQFEAVLPEIRSTIQAEKDNIKIDLKTRFSDYDKLLKLIRMSSEINFLKTSNHGDDENININSLPLEKTTVIQFKDKFYLATTKIHNGKIQLNSKTELVIDNNDETKSIQKAKLEDIFKSLNVNTPTPATKEQSNIIDRLFQSTNMRSQIFVYKDKNEIDEDYKNKLEQSKISLKNNKERLIDTQKLFNRLKKLDSSKDNVFIISKSDQEVHAVLELRLKALMTVMTLKKMNKLSEKESLFIKAMQAQCESILNNVKYGAKFDRMPIQILPEETKYAKSIVENMSQMTENDLKTYAYIYKIFDSMNRPKDIQFTPFEEKKYNALTKQVKKTIVNFVTNNNSNADNSLQTLKTNLMKVIDSFENKNNQKIPASDGWRGFINKIISVLGLTKKYDKNDIIDFNKITFFKQAIINSTSINKENKIGKPKL